VSAESPPLKYVWKLATEERSALLAVLLLSGETALAAWGFIRMRAQASL